MDGLSGKANFRRVTQAAVMGAEVLDANRAWSVYEEIHSDSQVEFVWEPAGLESEWPRTLPTSTGLRRTTRKIYTLSDSWRQFLPENAVPTLP